MNDFTSIDPSVFNLSLLPWLSLSRRSDLPCVPGIYFCLTPEGRIVYIGEASCLRTRWKVHEKRSSCEDLGCDRIAWLSPLSPVRFERLPIERRFIKFYRPILNTQLRAGRISRVIEPLPIEKYPHLIQFFDQVEVLEDSAPKRKGMIVRRIDEVDTPGLGAKIKQARVADGRSVETLAKAIGISRAYWHDIEGERVRSSLPEELLRKIEEVLGVDFGVDFEN